MNSNRNYNKNNSTTAVKAVSAIIFWIFSIVYLYFFQTDILAVAQHALSGGKTHYNGPMGAFLITLALWLIHVAVCKCVTVSSRLHSLTYFPSLLLLTVLTDISNDIDKSFSFGAWLWVVPLLLVVWGWAIFKATQDKGGFLQVKPRTDIFSRTMWVNMLSLAFMFILVGMFSNSDVVFHYRCRAEMLIKAGKYDEALRVGEKSVVSDSNLTMIRCYALAKTGKMGEELFHYPVTGTSETIVPVEGGSRMMIYPVDSLYKFLGAKPQQSMNVPEYLGALLITGQAKPPVVDYLLCGYLVDRNLDAFVHALPHYYNVNDSLPRHYREALTLYTHLRSNPVVVYHNTVMDTDFEDMQKLEKECATESERKLKVFDQYYGTYWWYYYYRLCLAAF